MLAPAFTGFLLGLSLILAIGAQNAFVLRQGSVGAHVFAVCLTCALSDAILIGLGVAGFGRLAGAAPWLPEVMRWGGALFLLVYGLRSLFAAWKGPAGRGKDRADDAGSLRGAVAVCLAFTWLNPHVYLDTLVLLGAVAATMGPGRVAFGVGAATASFGFFFALGYGARLLAPVFDRPGAWRWLDLAVGVMMLTVAVGLVT